MKKTIVILILVILCYTPVFGQLDLSQYTSLNRMPVVIEHRDKNTNTLLSGGQVTVIRNLSIGIPCVVSTPLAKSVQYLFSSKYFKETTPPIGYMPSKEIVVDEKCRKIIIYNERNVPNTVELNYKIGSAHISGGDRDNQNNMDGKVNAKYQGIRVGEYYWMSSNFNHVEPKRYWWSSYLGGEETDVPMAQPILDRYMECVELDKTKYQINIDDFNKYYGNYYSWSTINYMNKWAVMEEGKGEQTVANNALNDANKWGLPSLIDFRQLAAMCPFNQNGSDKGHTDLNERDVRFALSAKHGDNPLTTYTIPGKCGFTYWFLSNTNKYGFNLMPGGARVNGPGYWFTNLCTTGNTGFYTNRGAIYGLFYTANFPAKEGYFALHDKIDTNTETSYHWMNVRWCRRLTDQELGYKLYITVDGLNRNGSEWKALIGGNDTGLLKSIKRRYIAPEKVSIVKRNIDEAAPEGYTELPKGYLRGFYVQYLLDNPNPTVSLAEVVTYAHRVNDIALNVGYLKDETVVEEEKVEECVIYPNPVEDMMNIKTNESVISVKIYSTSGKLVKTVNRPENSIEVSQLSSGIYITVVHTSKGVSTHKILKK